MLASFVFWKTPQFQKITIAPRSNSTDMPKLNSHLNNPVVIPRLPLQ